MEKKEENYDMAKENDVERRKMKKNAHPERIFIKLFITFRKTKSYHVLRINAAPSLPIPSVCLVCAHVFASAYTKSVTYTSHVYFSQLEKLVAHKIHGINECL